MSGSELRLILVGWGTIAQRVAALLATLIDRARDTGARLILPAGALGGIDALAAASRLRLDAVHHEIVKPPEAWAGTPAGRAADIGAVSGPATLFEGSARAAADAFPENANVAVVSSLAGLGLDRTTVALIADPGATANGHRVVATGAFGRMTLTLENRPLETNPKSSELTALSLVREIENRACPLVI